MRVEVGLFIYLVRKFSPAYNRGMAYGKVLSNED